ncbi:hypothetical protein IF650_02695 [Cellulosimicrobium terreum]|nr:hypothetical protein [Cellulosimicrobium terreum]
MLVSIAGGRMRLVLRSPVRARRRVVAAGVVVAVGLVVGGCTGEEPTEPDPSTSTVEAEPEPTEEPEPTPTETGPAKPERPAAMEKDDAEGAAAAAMYFMELVPRSLQSQDSSELKMMSHESCGFCDSTLENIEWLVDNDGTYAGGELEIEIDDPNRYVRDEATGIFPFDATINQERIEVADGDSHEVSTVEKKTWEARIEVGRQDGDWVIVEVASPDEADAG